MPRLVISFSSIVFVFCLAACTHLNPSSVVNQTSSHMSLSQTQDKTSGDALTATITSPHTNTISTPQKNDLSELSNGTIPPIETNSVSITPVCNRALPGSPFDISIPDSTLLTAGQSFSKTWRLQNAGSCTWTPQYVIILFSGNSLGAPTVKSLGFSVEPGAFIDITLDMVAPDDPGTYQSNWILVDSSGKTFGIGPGGNTPFWVRIVVVTSDTDTPTYSPPQTETPAA
jgi:hypothetical protein